MIKGFICLLVAAFLVVLASSVVFAAVLELPDSTSGTTLTAAVVEQCDITVPAGVSFDVDDIASATAATAASVSISNIVLATATKQLKLSIKASAANFTPSVALATTWAAGDVSWVGTWSNGTPNDATLSNGGYTEVATADADAATMESTDLVFTLAAKTTVKRSGNHTLAVTWKVESIGA